MVLALNMFIDVPECDTTGHALRSAPRTGQITANTDLNLLLDALDAPLARHWRLRTGDLDAAFADALVGANLRAFTPT
ncbi:hypothetical protein LY13_002338 [Prauserella aidingensis]|uniref:hypothetical protein n=1 Tax=Prauserella aidingensis TaxID=387890 RepID=UPI0020A404FE|nr:hypothetical protein [Prauserella aidingensis]MCP2253585.1 hypothetical protein [Prauserella aidingensis]